jgi:hypothetical protein
MKKTAIVLFGSLIVFVGCKKENTTSPTPLEGKWELRQNFYGSYLHPYEIYTISPEKRGTILEFHGDSYQYSESWKLKDKGKFQFKSASPQDTLNLPCMYGDVYDLCKISQDTLILERVRLTMDLRPNLKYVKIK